MIRQPKLLWVDLTVSVRHGELPHVFGESCEIQLCPRGERLNEVIEQGGFHALCFDLDFPDQQSLMLVRDTKARYPNLPILMLTLQHSEALAIWAFRTNVIDFLVKPISRSELHRSLKIISQLNEFRASQNTRSFATSIVPIPPEIPVTQPKNDIRLLPAVYYVRRMFRFKVRNETVAELCGMSPFRFSRLFHEAYGMTFQDFVIRFRILEACRLLTNPNAHVTDVAYAVGFNDGSYFTRTFKRLVGVAPSVYCREDRGNEQPDISMNRMRSHLHLPSQMVAS